MLLAKILLGYKTRNHPKSNKNEKEGEWDIDTV